MTKPIYPCLWFDGKAKEAAEYYCGIFPNSRIITDTPTVVIFEINGQQYMGLNGGPRFQFTEAVSFVVECDTQEELDHYWNSLTANGGAESMCGWLKDKYGLSWQIIPGILGKLMSSIETGQQVMQVVLQSKKLVIAELEAAAKQ